MFFRVLQQEMEVVFVTASLPHQPTCEQPALPCARHSSLGERERERETWVRARCGQQGASRG